MKKRFCAVLLVLACSLFAQEHWEYFNNYKDVTCIDFQDDWVWMGSNGGIIKLDKRTNQYEVYDHNDGLTWRQVQDIAIDSSGVKWFAMYKYVGRKEQGALLSFDGHEWKTYTRENSGLHYNIVYDIKVSSNGNVFVGTDSGLVVLENGEWKPFEIPGYDHPNRSVYSIAFDANDNLWLSTQAQIYKNAGNMWSSYDIAWTNTIAFDKEGNVWCGTRLTDVHIIKPNGIERMRYWESGLPYGSVDDIFIDDSNNKWFVTHGDDDYNGLVMLDAAGNYKYFYTTNSNLPSDYVNTVQMDNHQKLWIGTREGVVKIENDGNWRSIPLESFKLTNYIQVFAVDKNNGIWFGSHEGAAYFDQDHWTNYTADNSGLVKDWVTFIALDANDNPWFSTKYNTNSGGYSFISNFDGTNWEIMGENDPVIANSYMINALTFDHQGNLWFRRDENIAMFDGETWTYVHPPEIDAPQVNDIAVDRNGELWFASQLGVLNYDHEEWTIFTSDNSELNTTGCIDIEIDKMNQIWITTRDGLSCYNGEHWENYDFFQSHQLLFGLAIDSTDIVWVSVDSGLYKYENDEMTFIDQTDLGISLKDVYSIAVDRDNNKWLGTVRNGILKLGETYTGIEEKEPKVISEFQLQQNYPNPFNATTTLTWNLAKPGKVNITIYNTLGQRVATLVDGFQANLNGSTKWHGRDDSGNMVTSGIYFARLIAGDVVKTVKMAFVE